MAKRASRRKSDAPDGQLGDWLPNVPKSVLDKAEEFDKAHTSQGRAAAKLATAKANLIESMKSAKPRVEKCPVRNGKKFLVLSETEKIIYEVPKAPEEPAEK